MIEINLSPNKKKRSELSVFDLSAINLKFVLIAGLFALSSEYMVDLVYLKDVNILREEIDSNNKLLSEKRKELKKYDDVKKQIQELEKKEAELKNKISIVQEIVQKKQNPFQILKYISENIPADVWVTDLVIDDKLLTIKGHSKDWKSIGQFIENIKNSIFFNYSGQYSVPENAPKEINKVRIESFEISANIVSFK